MPRKTKVNHEQPAKHLGIEQMSIAEIQHFLKLRQNHAERLLKQRNRHVAAIEAIDQKLTQLRGGHRKSAAARTTANPDGKSTVQIIADIIRSAGKPLRVNDILQVVHQQKIVNKNGNTPSKAGVVFALGQTKDVFKKVDRGLYEVKENARVA